ncbi:MAG: ATP-binding protein [Myxococcales bacterium]|nr:ATP-binding protein [Myxococcales bacterium]
MSKPGWFEISHEGWRRVSTHRPVARLLLEAVQNALDADAPEVRVALGPEGCVIEDDSELGFADDRLIYTVFLSDKRDDPCKRGRLGRGLKELIAAMDEAVVHVVGTTVSFLESGRVEAPNDRTRGTRIELRRSLDEAELAEARAMLRMVIPPKGIALRVDGRLVRRRRAVLALSSCELETVVIREGVERARMGNTSLALYTPRRGERAHVFEMGVPVQPWNLPWHVDVGQRVSLREGRDGLSESYALSLKAALLEAMIHRYLDRRDLRAEWVHEVIARYPLKGSVLDAFVSRAFPRGAVLGGTLHADDRARQLGAHVIDASAITHGAYVAFGRVVETSDDYVRRRSAEFGGEAVEPDAVQERFAEAFRWVARRVAGRVVRVRFFARDPNDAGLLEDAVADADARLISFNVRGSLRFEDILEPGTFGVVLHELAHLDTPEHDLRFIERLQLLAGQASRILAEGGPELADALRRGDPDRRARG